MAFQQPVVADHLADCETTHPIVQIPTVVFVGYLIRFQSIQHAARVQTPDLPAYEQPAVHAPGPDVRQGNAR